MWQHCFLPGEQTAPHRLTRLKSRWIVKVPPLLLAVVHLMLGGLRNDVYGDDDRALVVNKAQGTSLPERQPKRYSPLKRVCR